MLNDFDAESIGTWMRLTLNDVSAIRHYLDRGDDHRARQVLDRIEFTARHVLGTFGSPGRMAAAPRLDAEAEAEAEALALEALDRAILTGGDAVIFPAEAVVG